MAGAEIRDAVAADAGAVALLLSELGYPVEAGELPRRLETFTSVGNGRVLVAVVDGAVRAVAAVETTYPIHHAEPVAHVSAFAVAGVARRRGLGRRLLLAVEAAARDAGCRRIVVTSAEHRDDAHAFYPANGWALTGRRFGRTLDR